jgi:mono/diheme cytochrome c family protein
VRRSAAVLALATALVASGCGTGGLVTGGDQDQGKKLFLSKCAGCHTLTAAGTSGTIGPNLDQLKPPEARVQRQVINGGGAMPAFKGTLTAAQITAVAKYVSSVAGR